MPRESQLKKSKIQQSPRSPPPPRSPTPRSPPPRSPPPRSPTPLPPIQKQTETPKIGLLDTFVQGFGWGLGTSVSRKIVDKIFSNDNNLDRSNTNLPNSSNFPNSTNLPNDSNFPTNDSLLNNVTEDLYKKYQDCLENNSKDNCYSIIENSKIE